MPVVNVTIQPQIIEWLLEQVDEELLDEKIRDNLYQWLDGKKNPTFNQVEECSKKTNIPFGYFFLNTPPKEEIKLLEYRTVDSLELAKPSRNLIDTINKMDDVREWMKNYRKDSGFDKLSIVGCLKDCSDVYEIAKRIRKDLDISIDWYKNCKDSKEAFEYIRSQLELNGVVIMLNGIVDKNTRRALNIKEFRSFEMIDEWATLIFINSADSRTAKLFSLFHEIAHIWLGENDLYNDYGNNNNVKGIEVICNAVASELLVPNAKFLECWNAVKIASIYDKIASIARKFNCGDIVIARKAYDNKFIDKKIYDNVVKNTTDLYNKTKEKKKSGGDYYNTMASRLDTTFVRALSESINTGRTTYTEAFRLTNTNGKTFRKIVEKLGGMAV